MTTRIATTTRSKGVLRTTSAAAPRIDPEKVRLALGAELVAPAPHSNSPSVLAGLRRQMQASLKSTGGRPGLEGAERRQKIPMADADWESLELIARTLQVEGVTASAGQVAGQLLHDAITTVRAGVARGKPPSPSNLPVRERSSPGWSRHASLRASSLPAAAQEVLQRVRGLPFRERLRLVELVVHDLAEEPGITDDE